MLVGMTPRANAAVGATAIGAAAAAAVLSPVPLADELVMAPALLGVATFIGRERGLALAELPWGVLARTAALGLAARAAINLAVAPIPGVAAIANAVTAAALTHAYAEWVDRVCSASSADAAS
jgi:uncharacterized protein (DUF697 family)